MSTTRNVSGVRSPRAKTCRFAATGSVRLTKDKSQLGCGKTKKRPQFENLWRFPKKSVPKVPTLRFRTLFGSQTRTFRGGIAYFWLSFGNVVASDAKSWRNVKTGATLKLAQR